MSKVVTGKAAEAIRKASENFARKKLALAEAVLFSDRTRQETLEAEDSLVKLIHKAAKTLGIDPNDPSKGKWHFDPETMTFKEVTNA